MRGAEGAPSLSLGATACAAVAALGISAIGQRLGVPVREVLAVVRMRASPDDAEVQLRGCQDIFTRAAAAAESRAALVWAGALERALEAMRGLPAEREVHQWCAGAVAALSAWRPEIAAAAASAGAVEELVRTARRFAADPQMQQGANLGLLLVRSPENRIRWAAAGGLQVNLEAIRRHYDHAPSQFSAWCLFAAGTGEPNELHFQEVGGVELGVRVMRDHAGSPRVREQVLNAMRAIGAHSDRLRSALVRAGFADAAVVAMREAPWDRHQQALGCGNFANLAEGDEGHRDALLAAGAVEAAARALQHSPRMQSPVEGEQGIRYTVYGECFKALEALAASEAARRAIAASVTKEAVIAGMRAEPEDWKVQTGGSALLRLLMD